MRLAGLILALLLAACGSRSVSVTPMGQKIAIKEQNLAVGGTDTVRFGRMHSGEIAVLPLLLENKTQQPLVVTHYERTCGCTTLDYENQPIKVDGLLPARLTFDARGMQGWQFKLLTIHLAGLSTPLRIYIEAEVE